MKEGKRVDKGSNKLDIALVAENRSLADFPKNTLKIGKKIPMVGKVNKCCRGWRMSGFANQEAFSSILDFTLPLYTNYFFL